MFDKLKKALGVDEEEEDYEGEDFPSFVSRGDDAQQDSGYDAPEPQAAASGSKRNKVVNINATTQLKVVLVKPEAFEDATTVAEHLNAKRTVVLNLE